MKKLATILMIVGNVALPARAQLLRHSELLGRPTDSSISVKLFFTDSVELYAEYGLSSGTFTNQTDTILALPNKPALISIQPLTPDTRYFYRVRYRHWGDHSFNTRPEYTFHTRRLAGSTFTFTIQADPHVDANSDTMLYRRCLQNQLEDHPDFMIDLGDFLMTDKLKDPLINQVPHDTIPYRCHLLRSFYESTSHSVPLFIALGNHEGEAGWYLNGTDSNIAVWDAQERIRYFLNPRPDSFYSGDTTNNRFIGQRENYYSWVWGDALFVVLDPYWYTSSKPDSLNGWRWTLGKVQYDWLKTTLEQNHTAFKFVFAHQLVGGDPQGRGGVEFADRYEWGGNNLDGTPGFSANRPGWYKPIKDLLTENHVNIFFHGHDHLYGQQVKDCLVYQETPQPGLPNFNSTSAADYGYVTGQIINNSGHLRVTVEPGNAKVEYVRAYLPANENSARHNKDVSATYFVESAKCYDSLNTGVPVIWNEDYVDERVFPNPFSTETKIVFHNSQRQKLEINILNLEGKLIRKLVRSGEVAAGDFEILWDGKDGSGIEVPSAVYILQISGSVTGTASNKIIKLN
ncbi:MAG: metallophosphoesterase [Chitinophagales bacterium]